MGTWSLDETLNLKEPRRNLVWSLEKIAIWENLFQDAATLLLKLGEAENENYGNNASGTFIDLFSLGPGEVAPTEAAPENRFPVLEEALKSSSKPRRLLALKAFGTALQTNSFHRFVGSEYQGLRKAKLWRPANINEQISAYQKVLKLLYSNLETLDEEEKQIAIKTLLDHLRGLLQITQLADEILQDLKSIIQKEYIDIREILKTISLVLHYDRKRLPQNIVKQLEEIESSLVGDDFHSLSKRYIGMELIEDRYDENGKRADKAEIHLNNLADQVIKNKEIIMPELNWLITEDAKNGYRFGHALGIKDKNFELLDTLLEKHREFIGNKNVSDFFLGGYFKALNELDSERWESIMDMLSDDPVLLTWVPSLTWRSGYTSDRAAARILELAKHGKIKPYSFRAFGLGSVIQDLSEDIFQQCIKFLLSCSEDYAISIVMDLYHFFYLRKDAKYKLPEDLTLEILTHPLLFKPIENGNRDQMDDYHWKEISLRFIDLYPKRSLELADQILAHFGEEGTIIEGYRSEADEVITTISAIYPDEIWGTVSKYLGPPIDARSYHLKSWLRGNGFFETEPGTLNIFNPDRIWAWVDEAPERRAWYLATFVPKTLFKAEGKICWAREILVRYGEREAVRGNLIANFYSEGWSGPASIHYQLKRDGLVEFRKDETDEKVKKWLDEIIAGLNKDIEREKIVEERRGF